MPVKRVRVHYRRFYRTSEPAVARPLAVALGAALRASKDGIPLNDAVRLRTYEDQDSGNVILNGRFVTKTGDVYGELVRYDPDANITLLVHGTDVDEFEVKEADKPNDAEVLRGMSFFLLRGDHALVIEQEMTNPIFERYLRWLLCHQAGVADRDVRIQLIPRALIGAGGEMLRSVKSITFQPPRLRPDEMKLGPQTSRSLAGQDVSGAADILDILRAAHFDTAVIERLAAEYDAAIELRLNVVLRAGKQNVRVSGEEALALLRNVPEEDLVLQGEGARKNRGIIERLNVQKDVERKGNILDRKDAWRALREAAATYREEGLIE